MRSTIDYLSNTGEGKRVMLKLLKADIQEGCYTKQYYQAGGFGDPEKALDYRGIVEYKGWIYRGKAVPHNAVEVIESAEKIACDHCGGLFPKSYCAQTTRVISNGREYLENICNHCRLHSDDLKVRDTANSKTCTECKITTCQFHPSKQALVRVPQETRVVVQGNPEPTMPPPARQYAQNPLSRYSAI